MNIITKKESVLEGELLDPIPRCPFYRTLICEGAEAIFITPNIDIKGCGFGGVCLMETDGKDPDWDKCSYYNTCNNTSRVKRVITTCVSAMPDILRPAELKPVEWKGVTGREWFKAAMLRDFEE